VANDPHNPDDPEVSGDGESTEDPAAETGGAGDGNREPPEPPSPDDDDGVGYKRPPKKHRFKPGQSGNPRGRTTGAKGLKTILKKELSGRVRITENGKTRTISKMELLVKRLVEKGGKGDFKSLAKLLDLGTIVFGMDDEDQSATVLTREEQAIIDEAAKRRRALGGKTRKRPTQTNRKPTTLHSKDDSKGEKK
jgi:hypothetical protein